MCPSPAAHTETHYSDPTGDTRRDTWARVSARLGSFSIIAGTCKKSPDRIMRRMTNCGDPSPAAVTEECVASGAVELPTKVCKKLKSRRRPTLTKAYSELRVGINN